MTSGALGVGTMLCQPLANRRRATHVGIDRRDVGGWRRRLPTEQVRHHPGSARDGGRGCAVGRNFQDAGLRQDSAAMAARGQRDAPHGAARDGWQAVSSGQDVVEHREIGLNDVRRAQVVAEHRREEFAGLADHRIEQIRSDVGFELRQGIQILVGRSGGYPPQAKPLAREVVDESRRFGILEHPLGLGPQDLGPMQRTVERALRQLARRERSSRENKPAGRPASSHRPAGRRARETETAANRESPCKPCAGSLPAWRAGRGIAGPARHRAGPPRRPPACDTPAA